MSSILRGNDNLDSSNLATDTELSTALAGKANTIVANDSQIKTALNASGAAPIYACRAWVNFNCTETVAIRASGNVSSITDNGVGDYTVNFSTAMPDRNFDPNMSYGGFTNAPSRGFQGTTDLQTTSIRFSVANTANTLFDPEQCSVSIFR